MAYDGVRCDVPPLPELPKSVNRFRFGCEMIVAVGDISLRNSSRLLKWLKRGLDDNNRERGWWGSNWISIVFICYYLAMFDAGMSIKSSCIFRFYFFLVSKLLKPLKNNKILINWRVDVEVEVAIRGCKRKSGYKAHFFRGKCALQVLTGPLSILQLDFLVFWRFEMKSAIWRGGRPVL